MKKIFTLVLFLTLATMSYSQWVNEFHYDNDGGDTGEFIEVAGPAGTSLAGWSIVLYNGNGGASYNTINLSGTLPDEGSGLGALAFFESGIQNGAPDGFALVDNSGTVIQFLSYEGSFTATNGVANGQTSMDVGVSETGSTPVGESLQLIGSGNNASDFTWSGPSTSSPGALNGGQTIPLPISLGNFEAKLADQRNVELIWTTITEQNNEYFIVEHSRDGDHFEELELVKGAGNSITEQNYSFMHKEAITGMNYYRLRQVDYDGGFSYSPTRVVEIENIGTSFTLLPNIIKDYVSIVISNDFAGSGNIEIIDLSGRLAKQLSFQGDAGELSLDLSELSAGHYFARLSTSEGLETLRFVKL
ncbi:MAG: T9SS type A sorting domain-containing protein [Bacteroidota bacterium]